MQARQFATVFALVAAAALQPAWGQGAAANYPSKPVQVVMPFPAGGPNDVEARLYLPRLGDALGKPFIIDIKPGAGGVIGTDFVAKAPPDGYTLLVGSSSLPVTAAMNKNLPYDTIKDLAPITVMTKRTLLLIVHPELPVKSAAEYIEYVRKRPGEINFGTVGLGSSFHLAGAWLHNATNTKVTFVHFKGVAQVNPEIMAGRLQATFILPIVGLPLIKAGKVKPLAVASADRLKIFPDLPALAEQGVPGYDYAGWLGFLAPAKTPPVIINKLYAEFAKIAKQPDIIHKLVDQEGSVLAALNPEDSAKAIAKDVAVWNKVVAEAGIKAEE